MKLSPLFTLLIVATSSTAFAQTPPANDPNPSTPTTDTTRDPNMAPATPTPQSGTQMAQAAGQTPTEAAQKDPHNIQSSGPEDWSMVKGHDKGFLTKQDAMPNSWLAQNFSSCDKDSDGKVTQAEYDSCIKRR
jgi:hypothetical protein